jgi:hypothetical protein
MPRVSRGRSYQAAFGYTKTNDRFFSPHKSHPLSLSNMVLSDKEMHVLDYGCSEWRRSSQVASNLYNNGSKLWTEVDLRDIEQQLAQSETRENFTIRSIDGTVGSIKNPMFGERFPIW